MTTRPMIAGTILLFIWSISISHGQTRFDASECRAGDEFDKEDAEEVHRVGNRNERRDGDARESHHRESELVRQRRGDDDGSRERHEPVEERMAEEPSQPREPASGENECYVVGDMVTHEDEKEQVAEDGAARADERDVDMREEFAERGEGHGCRS